MHTTNITNHPELVAEAKPDISLIKFPAGNKLIINKTTGELQFRNRHEVLQLVIHVKGEELIVDINASQVNINAADELNLSSKKISMNASEQVNIQTPGNLIMEIGKDCLAEVAGTNKSIAQVQKITAKLGNIEIKANDDVRVDGERVLFNCD